MSRVERSLAREEKLQKQAELDRQQAERDKQQAASKKRKKKKGGKIWILVLILALLVGFGGYYTLGLRAVEPGNTDEVVVTIPEGTGASGVVYILNDAGLVRDLFCARINARIGGHHPQANTYVLNRSMSIPQIMKVINTGDFEYIAKESIEVPDGARLLQVAEALSQKLPYSTEEIVEKWAEEAYLGYLIEKYWFVTDDILGKNIMYPLEGYLYADTYMLTGSTTIEEFTEMCLDRMDEELTPRKEAIDASGFTVHQFLTLTSIVTKEARSEDQAGVAGVFMNRLAEKMSLGSDVTVCYIFQEDRVDLKQSQLDSDNPYNTRKFAGLPPGPICQVVSGAMDAVLNYEKSDYLFFIADENGVVRYSTDNEGHTQNIEDYGLVKDEDSEEGSSEAAAE